MEEANGSQIVERIIELLKNQNISETKMKSDLGYKTNIWNWRTRNTVPQADLAIAIAHYLNVSVEYLILGHDQKSDQVRMVTDILSELLEEEVQDVREYIAFKKTQRKKS